MKLETKLKKRLENKMGGECTVHRTGKKTFKTQCVRKVTKGTLIITAKYQKEGKKFAPKKAKTTIVEI